MPSCAAGNSLSPEAPAASAAKHSDAVNAPGQLCISNARAARITSPSVLGETIIWPPAAATRTTSCTVSTVPAPISACSPKARAMTSTLASGSGELSGTSMRSIPASISAPATASASRGSIPRRMAISGRPGAAASGVPRGGGTGAGAVMRPPGGVGRR